MVEVAWSNILAQRACLDDILATFTLLGSTKAS
jgi:hypothetical protein